MGGSTGTISRVLAPITSHQEKQRSIEQGAIAQPGLEHTLRSVYGKISEVHTDQALIKARELYSNTSISGGQWIPLNHSVREIAERWGKLKKGQIVYIQYRGPAGADATATIIKEAGEDMSEEKQVENTMSQNCYRIFGPGVGLG